MGQRIRKTPEELKRKYNATYRLRKKVGGTVFPSRGKIIFHADVQKMQDEPEVKILLSEFGFIIQPNLV